MIWCVIDSFYDKKFAQLIKQSGSKSRSKYVSLYISLLNNITYLSGFLYMILNVVNVKCKKERERERETI